MSHSTEHLQAEHQNPVNKGSEVFVGGLARTVTEHKIREVFSACGKIVEIRLIQDQSGNLKGFGFVRFASKEAAEKAVKEKTGYVIDGRKIGVLPSLEQDTLFFGNLYKGWSAEEFENLIHQVFPDVVSVNLVMHGDLQAGQKQRNRGFAFVKFSSHADKISGPCVLILGSRFNMAASRAYRLGTSSEFLLGDLHPAIQWAEEEPEINQKELAKIKIAFVRNLPSEADESYLRELFERFGKVERVVLPRKGNSLVGFVHFDKRHDLDNAIKELNDKTVPGPNGGPPYKLQVEVARPMDKSKKRVRDESQSKSSSKIQIHSKEPEEVKVSDPYEAAIVALPAVVTERLLRIMRLGIATRYDITIQSLTCLKELPESTVISILDQFMLSGADVPNKGAYLEGLIAKHYFKVGKHWSPSSVSRVEDATLKEPDTVRYSKQVRLPVVDSYGSHVLSPGSRCGLYGDLYSPTLPHHPLQGRVSTRLEETGPPLQIRSNTSAAYGRAGPTIYSIEETSPPLQRQLNSAAYGRVVATLRGAEEASGRLQVPPSSAAAYGRVVATLRGTEEASARLQVPPSSAAAHGRVVATLRGAEEASARLQVPPSSAAAYAYGRVGLNSYTTNAAADHQPTRSQVRFDPFTGEPYKFDPFTGEPILPESSSR